MSASPENLQATDPLAGRHLLFVVNEARFLVSHRLALLEEALRHDMRVSVLCGVDTGEQLLRDRGIAVHPLLLSRSHFYPNREWALYRQLKREYRALKPDIAHHVTIKPVIYGTRAALAAKVPAVVNAVPGMGFVFIRRGTFAEARRRLVYELYRRGLRHPNMRVIFQNNEDLKGFVDNDVVAKEQAVLIRGSGVDLTLYPQADPDPGPPVFLLLGRMLTHKGVVEFVEAARTLGAEHPDWRFQLVGTVDPGNPSSLSTEQLEAWQDAGVVEWLGYQADVPALLKQSHVVVLPSYREGLPKTLLEASAAGRAIVATDVPGCREVVRHGMNGLLVPARDSASLTAAMRRLGCSPAERLRMGRAGRVRAEALYRIEDVVQDTFLIYQQLLEA